MRAAVLAERATSHSPAVAVCHFDSHSPLGLDVNGSILLLLKSTHNGWSFRKAHALNGAAPVCHAEGLVAMKEAGKAATDEFARFERLVPRENTARITSDLHSAAIQSSTVYSLLLPIVDYAKCYRGVRTLAARDNRIAAKLVPPNELADCMDETMVLHPALLNCFTQVAGIHANYILENRNHRLFKLSTIELIRTAPDFLLLTKASLVNVEYNVIWFATPVFKFIAKDILVYDASTGRLVMILLGVVFKAVDHAAAASILPVSADHDHGLKSFAAGHGVGTESRVDALR
jgi:hypothetical protein